jgi:hypothetical protein
MHFAALASTQEGGPTRGQQGQHDHHPDDLLLRHHQHRNHSRPKPAGHCRSRQHGPSGRRSITARIQLRTQPIEPHLQPPPHGPRRHALQARHLRARAPVVVTKQDRRAVGLVQRQHQLGQLTLRPRALEHRLGGRRPLGEPGQLRLQALAGLLMPPTTTGEVACDNGQPPALADVWLGRRPQRRQPRVLHEVLGLIARQAERELAQPFGMAQQVFDAGGNRLWHGSLCT